jgi:Tol biopolymer transport system component
VDLFGWDRQSGRIERLNVDSDGSPVSLGELSMPAISRDGRWVAFQAGESVRLRDRKAGTTRVVSVSTEGEPAHGAHPSISDDGRFVAFQSESGNLVAGDTNQRRDVFVWDRVLEKTELVSVAADGGPSLGDWEGSYNPAISGNGRFVAFLSQALNLAPRSPGWAPQLYVRDLETKKTERVSVGPDGEPADGFSHEPAISDDGHLVVFHSESGNLVPEQYAGIFIRDRHNRQTEFVAPGESWRGGAAISRDGRFLAFASSADGLAPGDTNGRWDVFVAERQ